MASGVRDLDQDSGHKLLGVDPLVSPWLPSVMSALAGANHLFSARGEAQAKIGQVELPKLQGFKRSDDGAYAVALARGTVLIFDGATGQERARLVDFVDPTRMAFAKDPETSDPTIPRPSRVYGRQLDSSWDRTAFPARVAAAGRS